MDKFVEQFEKEYPTVAKEFKKLQEEQYCLFAKKMLNYGLGNISVGTQLANEEEKDLALTGIWFRSNDKMQRLKQMVLLKQENPLESSEPIEDAYKDLSVYSIIALLVRAGYWHK